MGNWNSNSHWIPLHYIANNEETDQTQMINFGLLNSTENTVDIRGYTVPYSVQSVSDESLSVNLSVCGGRFLRDGLQIRWLQTIKIKSTRTLVGDVLTLKNVVITHKMGGNCSHINSSQAFTPRWGELRNCGAGTSPCGVMSSDCLLFGANCTTVNCNCIDNNTFVVLSRIATTLPLNTLYTCPSDGRTSTSSSKTHIQILPSTVSTTIQFTSYTCPSNEGTSTSSSIQTSPTSNVTSLSTPGYLTQTSRFSTTFLMTAELKPTPLVTTDEIYEIVEREELAAVTANIRSFVSQLPNVTE